MDECGGDAIEDCMGVCEGTAEEDCEGICDGEAIVTNDGYCCTSDNLYLWVDSSWDICEPEIEISNSSI